MEETKAHRNKNTEGGFKDKHIRDKGQKTHPNSQSCLGQFITTK